jgi:hypothetical protein
VSDHASAPSSRFMRDYPRGPSLSENLGWLAVGVGVFGGLVAFFATGIHLRLTAGIAAIGFPTVAVVTRAMLAAVSVTRDRDSSQSHDEARPLTEATKSGPGIGRRTTAWRP